MTAQKPISHKNSWQDGGRVFVSQLQGFGKWRRLAIFVLVFCMFSSAVSAKTDTDWEKELEKGNHELAIGKIDEAIKIFEKKVDKNPQSGACRTALGMALKKKGKTSEAKAQFREATRNEPTYAQGFYELGSVCESDKEWKEAEQSFQRYLELKPDDSKRKTVEDRIRFCQNKQ